MKKVYSENSCKVTFSLPKVAVADDTASVVLLGDFNDWERAGIPLKANGETFYTEIDLEAGRDYEFRYLINNKRWENDWNADKYVPSPYEGILNSVVSVPVEETTTPIVAAAPAPVVKAPAKAKAPAKKKAAPKAKKVTAKKAPAKKLIAKKAAAKPKKDNLKRIEGIGPKIASVLTEAGIATFKELSATTPARIREVLIASNPKYKMYVPATWPEQATLAAKGEWDKLKTLQDELDGGKRR